MLLSPDPSPKGTSTINHNVQPSHSRAQHETESVDQSCYWWHAVSCYNSSSYFTAYVSFRYSMILELSNIAVPVLGSSM